VKPAITYYIWSLTPQGGEASKVNDVCNYHEVCWCYHHVIAVKFVWHPLIVQFVPLVSCLYFCCAFDFFQPIEFAVCKFLYSNPPKNLYVHADMIECGVGMFYPLIVLA
jgi:hypothetical protein